MVDYAMISVDKDRTVCESIRALNVKAITKDPKYQIAFANGGDQNNDTIPERHTCEQFGIELIDGLGDKIQSSSWLLQKN